MSRPTKDFPEGFFVALVFWLGVLGLIFASLPASSAEPIKPGMVCTLPDAWYGADAADHSPSRPEPVLVLDLKPLPTAEPGAWIKPLHGRYTYGQFHIKAERLRECRA